MLGILSSIGRKLFGASAPTTSELIARGTGKTTSPVPNPTPQADPVEVTVAARPHMEFVFADGELTTHLSTSSDGGETVQFRVIRGIDGAWGQWETLPPGVTTLTDQVQPGSKIRVAVKARNSAGDSEMADETFQAPAS